MYSSIRQKASLPLFSVMQHNVLVPIVFARQISFTHPFSANEVVPGPFRQRVFRYFQPIMSVYAPPPLFPPLLFNCRSFNANMEANAWPQPPPFLLLSPSLSNPGRGTSRKETSGMCVSPLPGDQRPALSDGAYYLSSSKSAC